MNEDCAAFGHIIGNPKNKWNDSNCDWTKGFVCMDYTSGQAPEEPVTQPTLPITGPKFFVPKNSDGSTMTRNFDDAQ